MIISLPNTLISPDNIYHVQVFPTYMLANSLNLYLLGDKL